MGPERTGSEAPRHRGPPADAVAMETPAGECQHPVACLHRQLQSPGIRFLRAHGFHLTQALHLLNILPRLFPPPPLTSVPRLFLPFVLVSALVVDGALLTLFPFVVFSFALFPIILLFCLLFCLSTFPRFCRTCVL